MKKLIAILTILVYARGCAQIAWADSSGVPFYTVWQSKDKIIWTNIATVKYNSSNHYCYNCPANYFYLVKGGNVTSNTVLTTNPLPVKLSNISVQNRVLKFTSNNEDNLQSYILYESIDGINFVEAGRIPARGNSNYEIQLK